MQLVNVNLICNLMYFSLKYLSKVHKKKESVERRRKCKIVWILVNSAELHLCTLPDALIRRIWHFIHTKNLQLIYTL